MFENESTLICLILCNPMDDSLPGYSVHQDIQAEYWSISYNFAASFHLLHVEYELYPG